MSQLKTCSHCGCQYAKGRQGYCSACGNYLRNRGRLPEAHEMRKRHTEVTLCTNCQQGYAMTRKRGLCQACERHLHKYGKPRSAKPKAKICARCREAKVYSSGLCSACYHYQNTHNGKKRPRHLWAEKRCRTCGRSNVTMTKGECRTCYEYRYLYGKDRPAHLWQRWNPTVQPRQAGMCHCKVCGKPAAILFRQRCTSCYGYWWKHKRDRPAHLWQRWAPHGWCECGQPAVTTVTLGVQYGSAEYRLCKDCMEAEKAR